MDLVASSLLQPASFNRLLASVLVQCLVAEPLARATEHAFVGKAVRSRPLNDPRC